MKCPACGAEDDEPCDDDCPEAEREWFDEQFSEWQYDPNQER